MCVCVKAAARGLLGNFKDVESPQPIGRRLYELHEAGGIPSRSLVSEHNPSARCLVLRKERMMLQTAKDWYIVET